MYVKNENSQFVSAANYAEEILTEGFGLDQVTEDDAKNALSELYTAAYNSEIVPIFDPGFSGLKSLEAAAFDKEKLWDKLKKQFVILSMEHDARYGEKYLKNYWKLSAILSLEENSSRN